MASRTGPSNPAAADPLAAIRELLAADRIELASSRLRDHLRTAPRDVEALSLYAAASLRARQPEEALRAAESALDLDPDANALVVRVRALVQLDQPELAAGAASTLAAKRPKDPTAQKLRAQTALKTGDLRGAKEAARRLEHLAPQSADGPLLGAIADLSAGRLKAAQKGVDRLTADFPGQEGISALASALAAERAKKVPWWRRLFGRGRSPSQ